MRSFLRGALLLFLLDSFVISIASPALAQERPQDYQPSSVDNLNDTVSDVITYFRDKVGPKPLFLSQRIQVCTTNLLFAAGMTSRYEDVNPLQHVGILVDGKEVFTDPGGGGLERAQLLGKPVNCHPTPVFQNRTEEQLVQLITCIGNRFEHVSPYAFFDYNCGGFTRDVLLAAGMGMPLVPNAGLGIWYPGPLYFKNAAEVQAAKSRLFREIAPACTAEMKKGAANATP